MVGFGKRLRLSKYEPWAHAYLDYDNLKQALQQELSRIEDKEETIRKSPQRPRHRNHQDSYTSLILPHRYEYSDFEPILEQQIEKIVLFFLQKQGELAKRLMAMNVTTADPRLLLSPFSKSYVDYDKEYRTCLEIGEELVLLINFVELNVTGLRKIFKKHDKHFVSTPITSRYMTPQLLLGDGKVSHLPQMYHYEGIEALIGSLQRRFHFIIQNNPHSILHMQHSSIRSIRSSSSLLSFKQPDDINVLIPNILRKIEDSRRRLEESSGYARAMAATSLVFQEDDFESVESVTITNRRTISNLLNLVSTFLYMTNYYIVAPTSGMYATRLGMSEALAGVIIGMTPLAAMLASILYSWWSNHSYRDALLFAATCSIIGDMLYALALPFHSIPLIILGRLLNGFGGARAINRRYIADAFSRNERTTASAAFVTAGALGMAAGPALAVISDQLITHEDIHSHDSSRWVTIETAPGWIMTVLWSFFLIITMCFFEDPQPRGEPKKKESSALPSTEMYPLLVNGGELSKQSTTPPPPPPPLHHNVAVMTSLLIYLVLKLILECLLSSTATVTSHYFQWDATRVGSFLAILGLLMFPAHFLVAIMSRRFEDREIVIATELLILVGTIAIVGYFPGHYSVYQYIAASICCFLGTNMLEAPNMSILSKSIPSSWARGTFNSGLLATEAGTLGRVLGDFIISAAGLAGIDRILDLTFLPMTILVLATLLTTIHFYSYLEPEEDDDD